MSYSHYGRPARAVLWTLLLATAGTSDYDPNCPEGEVADQFLLHFQPDDPRGIPGLDTSVPWCLPSPTTIGPISLVDTCVSGLNDAQLHRFGISAHLFTGGAMLSIPWLKVSGVYEIPGLWWTTTGNFSATVLDLSIFVTLKIAVLEDSCFYVEDFTTVLSMNNFSYEADGALDDSGWLLELFFDDLLELIVNVTKPATLDVLNKNIRLYLTRFLPPRTDVISANTSTSMDIMGDSRSMDDSVGVMSPPPPPPMIPSREDQKKALVRFVRFQVPWMIGEPLYLPNVTLNILQIAELHHLSVHGLSDVTQITHLSLEFDGEKFIIKSKMFHEGIFNRHRVKWFPNTPLLSTWQWTEAYLGLVKHSAKLELDRKLSGPPKLTSFTMRPVVFDPNHRSSGVRTLDRWTRRLLDGIKSEFGDSVQALLYSPIVKKANRILRSVDARTLIKNFVCYAARAE